MLLLHHKSMKMVRVDRLPLSFIPWQGIGSVSTHYTHGSPTESVLSDDESEIFVDYSYPIGP